MRMKSAFVFFTFILAFPALVAASQLGTAGDYNVFILGDIDLYYTDSYGGVAAGGNVTLEDVSVGSHLQNSLPLGDLVVGGDLDWNRGSVGSVTDQNGTIVVGGTANLNQVGSSSPTSGRPIDFNREWNDLTGSSSYWSTLASNGETRLTRNGPADPVYRIDLLGTDSELNIFNLGALNVNQTVDLRDLGFYLDVPATSTILINVPGKTAFFESFGFYFWDAAAGQFIKGDEDQAGLFPDTRILYNFFEADALTMAFIEMHGSVLAPWADVLFSEGHIEGNLIANSLAGWDGYFTDSQGEYRRYYGGEAHDDLFDGKLPRPVAEPATLVLVVAGLLCLALIPKRRCSLQPSIETVG